MLHRDHLSRFKVLWEEYNDIGRPYTCRDEIIRAVCPQLHGMYFVKMCLLLTIIGGSARSSNERNNNEIDANHHPDSLPAGGSSAVSRRSQSHLLIVGVSMLIICMYSWDDMIRSFKCRILELERASFFDSPHHFFLDLSSPLV